MAQPLARRLECAQLAEIAAELGVVEIGEQSGNRFVAGIDHGTGVGGIGFSASARGVLAQLREEGPAPPVDQAGELLSLKRSEWHAASVGAVHGAKFDRRQMPCRVASYAGCMKTKRSGFLQGQRERRKLAEPTRCSDCGAVYRDGRWTWAVPGGPAYEMRCPACWRIHARQAAGYVRLSGEYFERHRAEILRRVRRCEEAERADHPLERIMAIAAGPDGELVTTTGVALARRIAHGLKSAFKGEVRSRYSKDDKVLRVYWSR